MRRNWKDCEETVQAQMSAVENYLLKTYGRIDKTWVIGLRMLAENLTRFYQTKEQLDKDGLYYKANNGWMTKHPLLEVQKNYQSAIVKLLSEFGLTPKSTKPIANVEPDETEALKNLLLNQ